MEIKTGASGYQWALEAHSCAEDGRDALEKQNAAVLVGEAPTLLSVYCKVPCYTRFQTFVFYPRHV